MVRYNSFFPANEKKLLLKPHDSRFEAFYNELSKINDKEKAVSKQYPSQGVLKAKNNMQRKRGNPLVFFTTSKQINGKKKKR